jgi:uncharacterized SAM-binding protein YcdF (DUF218 family)
MRNPEPSRRRLSEKPARLSVIFWRTVLTLLFTMITLGAAAFLFPRQVLTIDSGEKTANVLVVLGGGDGRAERAADLYHEGAAPAVLVTGFGDCESNVEVLIQRGVPAAAITAEPKALTTYENVTYSLPLLRRMHAQRVIIVTSWYHSRRALACFEQLAPDLQFYSRPSYFEINPRNLNRAGYSEHVNIEYLKILVYWLK